MVQHYRKLIAWQKAIDMVVHAYQLTSKFPREELYGLTSQVRRSAVSVPSNIAEGSGRRTPGEFVHFLGNSCGSLCELETQVIIAGKLTYLPSSKVQSFLDQTAEVGRITNGLISSLTTDH